MNDFSVDDGDPVNIFAIAFVASLLVPIGGARGRSQWAKLALVQCVVACAAPLVFRPSGDGLYVLPIALTATATVVASILATFRIC